MFEQVTFLVKTMESVIRIYKHEEHRIPIVVKREIKKEDNTVLKIFTFYKMYENIIR